SPAQDSGNRWLKDDGSVAGALGLKPGAEERILNKLAPDYRYESRPIETPEDLGKAWVDNGGNSPLQLSVRIEAPVAIPIGKPGADTHSVNITHIDFDAAGYPAKVYFENPAGGSDHGYPEGTPLPAELLLRCMQNISEATEYKHAADYSG